MSQQSSRARALAYANEVKDRKVTRRTTRPDNFGKAKTSGPPTYAFQDQQRTEIDDTADATRPLRDEVKDIREDKEEDIVDKADFTPATGKGKAKPAIASTAITPAAASNLRPAFAKCWTTVDSITIPPKYYDIKSSYVPNSIKLFEVLHSMDFILNGNEELRYISPHYISLPVRIYYAIIFYVQIFRAKEQAGKLTPAEGSWLRAFFRRFKDTACPISGPLVPIFANIVSVLPADDQFDFVYPTIPTSPLYSVAVTSGRGTATLDGSYQLLPNVPALLHLLKVMCSARTITFGKTDEVFNYFDDDEQLIPFRTDQARQLGGIPFPINSIGDAPTQQVELAIANPALAHPFPESVDRLREVHTFWRASKASKAPTVTDNTVYRPTGPAELTLLDKEHDMDWFQSCIDMATIQAKFFSDSTNLSAIPTIGGESALVRCVLTSSEMENLPTVVTGKHCFYPGYWSSTKSTFTSVAADLELDHQYAAAYAITNADLNWQIDNRKIGSSDHYRTGAFWENTKVNFELDYGQYVTAGLDTMVQTQFYDARAKA